MFFEKKISRLKMKIKEELKKELKEELKEELAEKIKAKVVGEIKTVCAKLVFLLFSESKDTELKHYGWNTIEIKTLRGNLKDSAADGAIERFNREYEEKVKGFISGEDFIDLVVERILKKQLHSARI